MHTGGPLLGASVTMGQSGISNAVCRHMGLCHRPPALRSPCDPLGQLFCYTNCKQVLQLPWTSSNMLKEPCCADKGFKNSLSDNSSSQQGCLPRSLKCPNSTVNKGSCVALIPSLVISTVQWPHHRHMKLFFHFLFTTLSTSSSISLSFSSSNQFAHVIVPMDQFLSSCVCL